MSHHDMTDDGPSLQKALVFVLDDEPSGKKKKKKGGPNFKNFGAHVSITKLKAANKLDIGWRCRQGGSTCPEVSSCLLPLGFAYSSIGS